VTDVWHLSTETMPEIFTEQRLPPKKGNLPSVLSINGELSSVELRTLIEILQPKIKVKHQYV